MRKNKLTESNNTTYLEIVFSNSGTARAFINGNPTKIKATGSGYEKAGVILADYLNSLGYDLGDGGRGITAVIKDAQELGIRAEFITNTASGSLYKVVD